MWNVIYCLIGHCYIGLAQRCRRTLRCHAMPPPTLLPQKTLSSHTATFRLQLTNHSSSFAAASSKGIICFLRDNTPGSTTVPSLPTLTFQARSTSAEALGEDETKVASSLRMSTTKKSTSSSFSSVTNSVCADTKAACLERGAAGFVVSRTETRNFLPPILKIFVSIMTSSLG